MGERCCPSNLRGSSSDRAGRYSFPLGLFASAAAGVRVLLCLEGCVCSRQPASQSVSQWVAQATLVWFDQYSCLPNLGITSNPVMVCPYDQNPNLNLVNPCFQRPPYDRYTLPPRVCQPPSRCAPNAGGERSVKANRAAGLSAGVAGESALIQLCRPRGKGGVQGHYQRPRGVFTLSQTCFHSQPPPPSLVFISNVQKEVNVVSRLFPTPCADFWCSTSGLVKIHPPGPCVLSSS